MSILDSSVDPGATLAPLTPADCDLTDFPFMPLDCVRLRDSEMASVESPEACWAAVQLWAASWHQVPSASVPNDDRWLAQVTGYGRVVKEWLRVKDGAMRGYVSCSDGRLYHPVVAEKAREAWQAKLAQRWRSECARVKKHNQRHGTAFTVPDFEVWLSSGRPHGQPLAVPGDTPDPGGDGAGDSGSKRQGEGQRQGDLKKKKPSVSSARTPTIPCPYQSIVDLYHEHLPDLPRVKLMNDARQKAMRTFWAWVLSSTKSDGERRATTAEEALVWVGDYFDRASANDWLTGRAPRSGSHANWQCDFDFLLTERGKKHVIEKTREAA